MQFGTSEIPRETLVDGAATFSSSIQPWLNNPSLLYDKDEYPAEEAMKLILHMDVKGEKTMRLKLYYSLRKICLHF